MADKQFDRSTQDLGNIVNLGHVNVCISDQRLATCYYITGLGLTRDPFLNTGAGNMWVNVGVANSICRSGGRTCCAALPGWSCRTAPCCSSA